MKKAKQFEISQFVVKEAFERVKANKGSAGIDEQSIQKFEEKLEKNLYTLWNRMSSGAYFPPAVRSVEIPKSGGGKRRLGIPTVSDRVAQMVTKMYIEPEVEPKFHPSSFGYRPGRSALHAIEKARAQCMQRWWVIDLDIKAFFDCLDHGIMMKLLREHTNCKWILLYMERWLKAPLQLPDGKLVARQCGSPQGSVVSPLMANIYLHHAFDIWMRENFPRVEFERYADDIVVHCVSEKQAEYVMARIKQRLAQFKLELHPEKAKIVFCKNANRPGSYEQEQFSFLGYTFRPRSCRNSQGQMFVGFVPAISNAAAKKLRQTIRSWQLSKWTARTLEYIASEINPRIQGWINYYGRFHASALDPVLAKVNDHLVKWVARKFKRFHRRLAQARKWLLGIARARPSLFAQWRAGVFP